MSTFYHSLFNLHDTNIMHNKTTIIHKFCSMFKVNTCIIFNILYLTCDLSFNVKTHCPASLHFTNILPVIMPVFVYIRLLTCDYIGRVQDSYCILWKSKAHQRQLLVPFLLMCICRYIFLKMHLL